MKEKAFSRVSSNSAAAIVAALDELLCMVVLLVKGWCTRWYPNETQPLDGGARISKCRTVDLRKELL